MFEKELQKKKIKDSSWEGCWHKGILNTIKNPPLPQRIHHYHKESTTTTKNPHGKLPENFSRSWQRIFKGISRENPPKDFRARFTADCSKKTSRGHIGASPASNWIEFLYGKSGEMGEGRASVETLRTTNDIIFLFHTDFWIRL